MLHDYHKIVVLGMPLAGKTRFLCHLNGNKYEKRTTAIEDFRHFIIDVPGGKIYIDNGSDIGGTDAYCFLYGDLIQKNDLIFFIFDLNDFLYKEEYQRKTKARLDCIDYYCKEYGKKACIIASHLDIYSNAGKSSATAFQEIKAIVYNEDLYKNDFRGLFDDNKTFFVEDLTKKESALKVIDCFLKIF
ncbi:MAG: GTPase domain-containing protein [Bacteroidales bacterium]|nr:GTPase domain-containing protein [Bacteroidales bacterium]